MKKVAVGIFTICLLLGIGTGVLAKSDSIKCTIENFKLMLPMMQEKYPSLSEKELKEKHKECVLEMKKDPSNDCSTMMGN